MALGVTLACSYRRWKLCWWRWPDMGRSDHGRSRMTIRQPQTQAETQKNDLGRGLLATPSRARPGRTVLAYARQRLCTHGEKKGRNSLLKTDQTPTPSTPGPRLLTGRPPVNTVLRDHPTRSVSGGCQLGNPGLREV